MAEKSCNWWQPTSADPQRTSPPLQLLPSGPGWVRSLSSRGDRCRSPYCRATHYAGKSPDSQAEIEYAFYIISPRGRHPIKKIPRRLRRTFRAVYWCDDSRLYLYVTAGVCLLLPTGEPLTHGLTQSLPADGDWILLSLSFIDGAGIGLAFSSTFALQAATPSIPYAPT